MEADRCRDLSPSFAAHAAALTDTAYALRLQVHLGEGCPSCARELELLMEAFHAIPLGLAVLPTPDAFVERLVEAARSTPQEEREVPILFPETNALRLWWVLTALSALAAIALGFWGQVQLREVQRLRAMTDGSLGARSAAETEAANQQIAHLARLLDSTADPGTRILDLVGGPPGRAFLDVDAGLVTLSTDPLGPPGAGRLHYVWLGTSPPRLLGPLPAGYSAEGGQIALPLPASLPEGVGLILTVEAAGPSPPTKPGPQVTLRSR